MLPVLELRTRLMSSFDDAELEIVDLTGTQDHYECHIASAKFVGLSTMAQHKLVYAALREELKGPIHALSLKTYTPALWRERAPHR
jgi:stress-induced morphogen